MTLDDMFKQYVEQAVKDYLFNNLGDLIRERNIFDDMSNDQLNEAIDNHLNNKYILVKNETIEEVLDTYLNEHDYVTRDDVSDMINGAEVRIESVYLSA